MQTQRWGWTHRYAVPMFVASVVAVLLVGAAAVALLVGGDERGPGSGGGTEPPPVVGAAGVDPCLVGTWQVVAQTEPMPGAAGTMVLDGEGAVFEFRADGTGTGDYGDRTDFTADALGQEVVLTVTGTLAFRYLASGGTFQILEIDSDATFTLDALSLTDEYSLSQQPVGYQCDGDDTLRFQNQEGYAAEYRRLAA